MFKLVPLSQQHMLEHVQVMVLYIYSPTTLNKRTRHLIPDALLYLESTDLSG